MMEPRKQFKDIVKTKPITRIRNVERKDVKEDETDKGNMLDVNISV